jgi:hypothetical protein
MSMPVWLCCLSGYAGSVAEGDQASLLVPRSMPAFVTRLEIAALGVLRSVLRDIGYVRVNTHEC